METGHLQGGTSSPFASESYPRMGAVPSFCSSIVRPESCCRQYGECRVYAVCRQRSLWLASQSCQLRRAGDKSWPEM